MTTKIFVGNFSFSVADEQLQEYFTKIGPVVSAKVMTEGPGGRSRGFGFVEMSSPEDAQKAITELNGSVWDGRMIKVSEDRGSRRDREDSRPDHDRRGGGGGGGDRGERSAPTGYFRAQPMDFSPKGRRKKLDPFVEDKTLVLDYKDAKLLSRFMSERGRVLPRRMTGLTSHNQRMVTLAIKRAQHLALLPYTRS